MFTHWKHILRLALPSIVSFASMTLTGTINLIMVGHMGPLVIAAVGVSNIIMYNAWALCSGLGHTVNYLVAQNYGASQLQKAVERTYLALYTCIMLGVALVLAGVFAPGAILRLMGGSPELVQTGEAYLSLRFFGMIFSVLNFVLHGFMRGIGNTKTPMALTIASNLAMIFFTYALIDGRFGLPDLGLPGAAWGILIGELLAFLAGAYVFWVRMHPQFGTRVRVGIHRAEARLMLLESGKLGVQEFAMSAAMFVFTMIVTRLGTNALAANEVALNVMGLGFMPAFGFGAAATTLVGQEIGRRNPGLARRLGTETAMLGSLFLLALGAVEFIWAEPIARIYSTDPEVSRLAADLIRVSAFLQLFDGLFNFYGGGLRGIGDTAFLVKASFGLSWLVFVPLAFLFTFGFGWHSMGAWVALYTFITVYGIAVMVRFYKKDWDQIQVKQA